LGTYGSVRGAVSNHRPYRDPLGALNSLQIQVSCSLTSGRAMCLVDQGLAAITAALRVPHLPALRTARSSDGRTRKCYVKSPPRTRHDSSRHACALHLLWMVPDPG